ASLCAAAARNNAEWCDAVARAHDGSSAFNATAWINRRPAPRFYSNLITLGGAQDSAAHMAAIRQLLAEAPAPRWSVKDGFAAPDLAPLGFDLLFEARWIHRSAGAFDRTLADCRAQRMTSEPALAAWERAWRAGEVAPPDHLFRPALLAERDHAFIAVMRA